MNTTQPQTYPEIATYRISKRPSTAQQIALRAAASHVAACLGGTAMVLGGIADIFDLPVALRPVAVRMIAAELGR